MPVWPPRHDSSRADFCSAENGRLADGEERQHPGGAELMGRQVAHIVDHDGGVAGALGQLDQGCGGLAEDAVDAGGAVGVRRHLRHDQHRGGHAPSVRLVRERD